MPVPVKVTGPLIFRSVALPPEFNRIVPKAKIYAFAKPTPEGDDEIYAGYVRRGDKVSYVASGRRSVRRDPEHGWVTGMDLTAVDEHGVRVTAQASAVSRMLLPHSTSVCGRCSSISRLATSGSAAFAVTGLDE